MCFKIHPVFYYTFIIKYMKYLLLLPIIFITTSCADLRLPSSVSKITITSPYTGIEYGLRNDDDGNLVIDLDPTGLIRQIDNSK